MHISPVALRPVAVSSPATSRTFFHNVIAFSNLPSRASYIPFRSSVHTVISPARWPSYFFKSSSTASQLSRAPS